MTAEVPQSERSLVVAISGASGLIGRRLATYWSERGYEVRRLVRASTGGRVAPGDILWNPIRGGMDAAALEGVDAVVHLAGENIAGGRWTAARKEAIRSSRVEGTRVLCECLAQLARPPRVLVAASAVGYYGDRGDELLLEESPPGRGFLADVVCEWEAATETASRAGIRVVNMRLGVVLAREGGALAKMLTPFKLGLGGRIGGGRQYVSWIAAEDAVRAIEHVVQTERVTGPVNTVSPNPATNTEFATALARALGRPAVLPLPAPVVRFLFGEMGQETLLASTRASSRKLHESGYSFVHPTISAALTAELAPPKP